MAFRYKVTVFLSFLLFLGCSAHRVSKKEDLNTRILALEQQLQEKEEQIRALEEEISILREKNDYSYTAQESGYKEQEDIKPTAKRIQQALKNAGFYSGPIDGVIGKKTRLAIKEFQKANGLTPDGIVGKKTWMKLRKYLK